jgi:hypothetical protein
MYFMQTKYAQSLRNPDMRVRANAVQVTIREGDEKVYKREVAY